MKYIIRITFLTLVLFVSVSVQGQSHMDHDAEHHHYRNEISVAAGVVPLTSEEKVTAGLHLHYVRGIGAESRFGVGTGLELIFDEHRHYTISVVFQYRLYKGLILGYAPGLLIRRENSVYSYQLAHHFEAAYEFELGQFHIGPMLEVGVEQQGVHYMLGIHFGYDF